MLGAVVDALARDVAAATSASASGPGGRAAAVAALAAFASGSPIDRLAWSFAALGIFLGLVIAAAFVAAGS